MLPITAMKQVTRSDSRRRSKGAFAHAHRVALAQGCQANAHRLRPQVVVLRGGGCCATSPSDVRLDR